MSQRHLIIVSDSPSSVTGLARISRELAVRIHKHMPDTFRLATLGLGGQYSRRIPWRDQYFIRKMDGWVIHDIVDVVRDFCPGEKCTFLFVWNPGWLTWMANPDILPDSELKACLKSGQVERWIYAPIDAVGQNGLLPQSITETLLGFDRRLFYNSWAAKLFDASVKDRNLPPAEYLLHGTEKSVFHPHDRMTAREVFMHKVAKSNPDPIKDDVVMVGMVGTNSERKNWPLCLEVCGELLRRGVNLGLWMHTDKLQGHWDLRSLLVSHGMMDRVICTLPPVSSENLAWGYSAMDCMLLTSTGEGHGFPLAEALACGVPIVHGNYAGGAEIVPKADLVEPCGWYTSDFYGHRRPVYRVTDWADKVMAAVKRKSKTTLDDKWYWDTAWPDWERWLAGGPAQVNSKGKKGKR